MNGVSIKVERSDYIGSVSNVRRVGALKGAEVFIDESAGQLIICQPDHCLVVA